MFGRWLTFGLGAEQEDRFRQARLGADLAQARFCILLTVVASLAFVTNDYGFFGPSWRFYGLQALRLGIVVYTVLLVVSFRRRADYRAYDRAEFAWALAYVAFIIAISATRPHTFVGHATPVALTVFITLLAIPNRFTNQLAVSGVLVGGEALVLVLDVRAARQAAVAALVSLFAATAIAAAAAWYLHFLHRREFLAREEEREARAEAERQLAARRQAEAALARDRALLDAVVRQMPVGLVVLDREARVVARNAQAEQMSRVPTYGAFGEAYQGTSKYRRADGTPYETEDLPAMRALRRGETIVAAPMIFDTPEGEEVSLLINAAPLRDATGEIAGSVSVYWDVTEQRQAEEALLAAERARTRLAETLTSEIAHRTKNNLAIVAGLLQLQLDRAAVQDGHADLIRDAVTRIMSFAALHEQMYQRHSDTVELLDALRRVAEVARQALSAGEVAVSVEGVSADYPSGVATNLCVIANELITNALKHGGGSEGDCRIEVRLSRGEGRLLLSVWNSGSCIAPDFDVRGGSRTGLGLVHTIVEEQYGGSFTLRPHQGGTLAHIALEEERLLHR